MYSAKIFCHWHWLITHPESLTDTCEWKLEKSDKSGTCNLILIMKKPWAKSWEHYSLKEHDLVFFFFKAALPGHFLRRLISTFLCRLLPERLKIVRRRMKINWRARSSFQFRNLVFCSFENPCVYVASPGAWGDLFRQEYRICFRKF